MRSSYTSYSQLVNVDGIRRYQYLRNIRAAMHDTRALIKEFRRPLVAILIFIFLGGWVYGELMEVAGLTPPPYIDLPYYMLSLMVLEQPTDVPTEWYLIIFWYLQPAVAIYIIGQGAVDFFGLFFNRNERRSAWELAVASTYRNHVLIVGVGHVGLRIVKTLYNMGFEIVVIDDSIDASAANDLKKLDIPIIQGDGRLLPTLEDAGLRYARAMVICTSNDHINLEVTMRARDINPEVRITTRMWDDRFASQLKRFLDVQVLSASDLAAPAFAGAAVGIEVTQTLRVGDLEYSMIKLEVRAGSFMEGKTIDFLQDDEDIDIVLHGDNGGEPTVHPGGDIIVKAGDTLVLFANHRKITEIVSRNQSRR